MGAFHSTNLSNQNFRILAVFRFQVLQRSIHQIPLRTLNTKPLIVNAYEWHFRPHRHLIT